LQLCPFGELVLNKRWDILTCFLICYDHLQLFLYLFTMETINVIIVIFNLKLLVEGSLVDDPRGKLLGRGCKTSAMA
jgi:hypothetical protein